MIIESSIACKNSYSSFNINQSKLKTTMKLDELEYSFSYTIIFNNKDVYNFLKDNKIILAGGSILNMLNKTKHNDYDLYIKGELSIEDLKKEIKKFNNKKDNCNKFKLQHESTNSISYLFGSEIFQFIKLKHLMNISINELFESIDFSICMCAYDFEEDEFNFSEMFIKSYETKEVVFNVNTIFPISSLLRIAKYENKGYFFSTQEILKISFAINKLNIKTYGDVIYHLTAVSTSYYSDFLDFLSSSEYKDFKFDGCEFFNLFEDYKDSNSLLNKLLT